MDTLFLYLLAACSVACFLGAVGGVGVFSPGLAVRREEPTAVIAQNKGPLLLNCSIEHEPDLGPLEILWQKDGRPIDLGKRIQVQNNGSLFFRRVIHRPKKTRSDEGHYRCIARIQGIGSVIARDVDVKVAGIERKFDAEPQSQEAAVRGVARFECRIQAVPPAIYLWERNGTTLPHNENRYIILNSGILQITDVQSGDAGLYRCHATQGSLHELPADVEDIYGKYSDSALLTVTNGNENRPVRIVASSRNITAKVGTTAVLECLVDGYDGTVIWRRNGQRQPLQTDGRVVSKGDNLQFLEVSHSDSGQYECVAGNVIASMLLRVITTPVLVTVPTSARHPKAQWIYLKCAANGHPKPTIMWLKDGEQIDYSLNSYREGQDNQLAIVHSTVESSGYYQCVASNEAGSVTAFARIEIYMEQNVPDSPKNVRAENVTSTGFFLRWDPAKAKMCCAVLAYMVLYGKVGDSKTDDPVVIPNHYKVENLDPYSNYTVHVAAFSKTGSGHKSEPIVVQTKEDVPDKPVSISMEPRSSSILVRWNKLLPEDANGVIVEYRIFHKRLRPPGGTVKVETGVPGSSHLYLIQDLEPSTEYGVRMVALTSVGFKEFPDVRWPWVPVATTNGSYSVPPAIQLLRMNATAMNITWSPKGEKSVLEYSLQLRPLPATDNTTVIRLPANARHYMLHGLDENVEYELTLVEKTADSSSSTVIEFRTVEAPLPPIPRKLHVTMRTADSISLVWVQPETTMEISHYTVKYARWTDPGVGFQWKSVRSDQTSSLIEGLQPYTRYQLAVRAHMEHTATDYCTPISALTREGVPSEPQNIRVSTKQPGSVSVEWSPPAIANGNIKTYIILYTSNPSNSDELWIHVTRNGSVRSAIITVEDRSGKLYYFKLQASTETGLSRPTDAIPVNPSVPTHDSNREQDKRDDQRLGIIIGVSIGVVCIIVCVLIILLRNRCFNTDYPAQPQTQVVRTQGNGHIPGSRLAPTDVAAESRNSLGLYEMDAVTPMLEHVPENTNSDSKGGGNGSMILTPNGAKLNGFVPLLKNGIRNGQLPNNQMGYIAGSYKDGVMDMEETRGLIAAMLRGGDDHCIAGPEAEDSFTVMRDEDLGSLDDIDHSRENIVDPITKSQDSSRSEQSSGSGSVDRNFEYYPSGVTIPHSDTTDTGDTVIFRGSVDGDCPVSLGESESVASEHLSGTTIPRSLSDNGPADGAVRHCHNTNDIRDTAHCHESQVSRVALPQNQLSTSNQPQVLRSARDDRSSSVAHQGSRRDAGSGPGVSQGRGSSYDGGGVTHSHVHSNGEPRWGRTHPLQSPGDGEPGPATAAYNPTIPHSPTRERTPVQQSGDITLAELPQDGRRGKASSPKRHNHFKV